MANSKGKRREFGSIRQLSATTWQARFTGPDRIAYRAPMRFPSEKAARGWLDTQRGLIDRDEWTPRSVEGGSDPTDPSAPSSVPTFEHYAATWLHGKVLGGLKPRTEENYQRMLKARILPTFGDRPVTSITPADIREWHSSMQFAPRRADADGNTARAHHYQLVAAIMRTAEREDVITKTPCRLVGAATPRRRTATELHFAELPLRDQRRAFDVITESLPDRLRIMPVLGLLGALRFGEVIALRRKDVDLERGVLHVRRGVTRIKGETIEGAPKSAAGSRDVHLPKAALAALADHLATHVAADRDALVVRAERTDTPLAWSSLNRHWDTARAAAGRPTVTFHHLRHAGITLASRAGATDRENAVRSGHSSDNGNMQQRYQHSSVERQQDIAESIDRLWSDALVR